jgi:hypothetical protein
MDDPQKQALNDLVRAIAAIERTGKTRAYGEIFSVFCPCCGADSPPAHSQDCAIRRIRELIPTVESQIARGAPSSHPREATHEIMTLDALGPDKIPVTLQGVTLGHISIWGPEGWRWRCFHCGSYEQHDPWSRKEAHRAVIQHARRCDMRTKEI